MKKPPAPHPEELAPLLGQEAQETGLLCFPAPVTWPAGPELGTGYTRVKPSRLQSLQFGRSDRDSARKEGSSRVCRSPRWEPSSDGTSTCAGREKLKLGWEGWVRIGRKESRAGGRLGNVWASTLCIIVIRTVP